MWLRWGKTALESRGKRVAPAAFACIESEPAAFCKPADPEWARDMHAEYACNSSN